MILIEGSGRAADALVSLLKATTPSESEVKDLCERAGKAKLTRRPELFRIVPLRAGAVGLRDAILAAIGPATSRRFSKPDDAHVLCISIRVRAELDYSALPSYC
jgi:hypothetical protein